MTIEPGPHGGTWIKDGDKVLMWCYSQELAIKRLKELNEEKERMET